MTVPLIRGAVVLRDRRWSLVWTPPVPGRVDQLRLVLLPILVPRRALAHDVALELADLMVSGVMLTGAAVRPRPGASVPAAGHQVTGHLSGPTMCRVAQGVMRVFAAAHVEAKWGGGLPRCAGHRDAEKPVKLVG